MGAIAGPLLKPFKARKKPVEVTVQEFQPGDTLPLNVEKREDGTYFVRNKIHNTEVNIKPGDFICISDPDDCYPIEPERFAANFDRVEEAQ